jgi:flagellar M-ring protein FliF
MNFPGFLDSYSRGARTGLIAGAALILIGMAATLWWLFSPSYQLLFGNLQEADAAEVTKALTEWKVPYRYTDGGTGIEVPKDQVYDARMKLVSAGVPSGGHVGFELFDDADFGVTEFAQRVNYQRAMQGELERSISALPGVEKVRVHLTIRRPGLFVGQSDSSKASVAITMTPGEMLTPQQVAGVRNLVASAVEGLDPAAVVVLGPTGVLSGGGAGGANSLMGQNEEQSGYEEHVRARISDLLSQAFHLQSFRVSVDARLNFDQVRRVSEKLIAQGDDGNGLLVRKHSSRSNAPAATAADGTAAATGGQEQTEFEYAHGTEREEISTAPGKLERLSVAVLVPPTLSSAEIERLRKLVTAAAGLDPARGDRLEIGAIGANADERAPVQSPLFDNEPVPTAAKPVERKWPVGGVGMLGVWLALAGIVGLLLGWVIGNVKRGEPQRLRHEEREQVMLRLRSWLAEGEVVS